METLVSKALEKQRIAYHASIEDVYRQKKGLGPFLLSSGYHPVDYPVSYELYNLHKQQRDNDSRHEI